MLHTPGTQAIGPPANYAACWPRPPAGTTNLVDLEQQGIARLGVNGLLHALGVGAQQVVAHNLGQALGGEGSVRVPIVLVEGVLHVAGGAAARHTVGTKAPPNADSTVSAQPDAMIAPRWR